MTNGMTRIATVLVVAAGALAFVPAANAQYVTTTVYNGGYVAPAPVYVSPPPVVYAPPVVYSTPVYAAAPVYYSAPVVYSAPVCPPVRTVGFGFSYGRACYPRGGGFYFGGSWGRGGYCGPRVAHYGGRGYGFSYHRSRW